MIHVELKKNVSLTRKNPSPNLPQTRVGLPFVPVNNISIYQINRLRPYTLWYGNIVKMLYLWLIILKKKLSEPLAIQ
jgi:hypothetical protein